MNVGVGFLRDAFAYPFSQPVTAYLTDVQIVSCNGFGVMYRHAKAELHGPYWVLRTVTGSFYVIASFHPNGGLQSLQEFLRLHSQGVHFSP